MASGSATRSTWKPSKVSNAPHGPPGAVRKSHTSGYCTSLEEFSTAPARLDVHEEIREFLDDEVGSGFRRYVGLGPYLDEIYHDVMAPFIRGLP